jgi:hypothetical protein
MKIFLQSAAIILLLFNGTGALFGGWQLIAHPDGSGLQLTLDWLEHTPFNDYLVPGIILFIVNGLFSTGTLIALILKYRYSAGLVLFQGILLSGWIVVQVLLIRTVHPLHLIMGSVGIALIVVGLLLFKTFKQ